jgi:nicotinamide-nucleotide amidase
MPLAHDDAAILEGARALVDALRARGWMLATAESCTGGGIAHAITAIPGSSDVLDRGFVTYSNDAKIEMLGVDAAAIARHGVVSEAVALAMADGALRASRADVAVAVTGIAGPGGGSALKPVGTVCFAVGDARRGSAGADRPPGRRPGGGAGPVGGHRPRRAGRPGGGGLGRST